MADDNQTQTMPPSPAKGDIDGLSMHSRESDQLRNSIADLLIQVDWEAAQFRNMVAALLAQADALHSVTISKDALENLVSQLREANQNLVLATFGAQDLQAKAELVNRMQEEFLSMLAHELRNPLAPVSMAAELLGKITDAHPQLPKIHRIISRQINHMTHMVNDLVDASRVRSGKITLHKQPRLLSEIIESAVETARPFIDKRQQQLTIDLPVDCVIEGDLVRLAQVFSNLLVNAAKFTPEYERITVSARELAGIVAVTVKDTGMGIALDFQPFIFTLFSQGERALDRSQGGLGIGLSLVRTIVEMHGGNVSVKSGGEGLGSEFTVVLPRSTAQLLQTIPEPDSVANHSCRILLVDDNVDSNDALKELLSLEGHTVNSSFDGTAGLAMAKENGYDIIISDIGLPGMDGYELVRQLRSYSLEPVPYCIALTGYSQEQNRTRAIAAGFDYYLVKPVTTETLVKLISSLVMPRS
jgi:signal transduction histidine kinase